MTTIGQQLSDLINAGRVDEFRELWHRVRGCSAATAEAEDIPHYVIRLQYEGDLYNLATTEMGVKTLSEYGASILFQNQVPIPLYNVCHNHRTDEAFTAILALYEKYYRENPCLESEGVVARTAQLELTKNNAVSKMGVLNTIYPTISFDVTSATIEDLQPRHLYENQVKWATDVAVETSENVLVVMAKERMNGFVNFSEHRNKVNPPHEKPMDVALDISVKILVDSGRLSASDVATFNEVRHLLFSEEMFE